MGIDVSKAFPLSAYFHMLFVGLQVGSARKSRFISKILRIFGRMQPVCCGKGKSKISGKMKIAVPTRDNQVDNHFGHCDHYTIYTVKDGEIAVKDTLPSPQGCGCKSGVVNVLRQLGVEVMLAGSMGEGALNILRSNHIKVVRGCSGDVDLVVADYLDGKLEDSGEGCSAHGDEHHECGGHDGGHHECHHGH